MHRDDLLNRDEAAQYLRVSPSFLAQRVKVGGPVTTRIGRKVYYLRADLDEFILNGRTRPCRTSYPHITSKKGSPSFSAPIAPTGTPCTGTPAGKLSGQQKLLTNAEREEYRMLRESLGHFEKPAERRRKREAMLAAAGY